MSLITVEVFEQRHDEHDKKLTDVMNFLQVINLKIERFMATQAELLAALNALNDKVTVIKTEVGKIGTETQSLQANIVTLTNAVNNQGNTTPEVDAALAALQANADSLATQAQAVDDLVPDAPAPAGT